MCAAQDVGEGTTPGWAQWHSSRPYSVGIEEEAMLLDPDDGWALARGIDEILPKLSPGLAGHVAAETQDSVIELATRPHDGVEAAASEAASLRIGLARELGPLGVRAAGAGTHPGAIWTDIGISGGSRQQAVYGSMRELARREPTFGLHVHVGVADPEMAITLFNRLRCHLPLLLALSANSPYWQGRDTGLASARTPIFQAFPRVGVPRAFDSYEHYVGVVDLLVRCGAFPDPTFLWWDVRPAPRFGTVEVRVMDVQSTPAATRALVALVQSIARLELEEGYHVDELAGTMEVLVENRFAASRDGMDAWLIDPVRETRVDARTALVQVLDAALPHAVELGCAEALASVVELAEAGGADYQRRALGRRSGDVSALVADLADAF